MATPDRQRIYVSTHIDSERGAFRPLLYPAKASQPIARIDILDGLSIQAEDPKIFRALAARCLEAAASIDAAKPCKWCGRRLEDDDPSNTGLGHHVDCTLDGALAGQPS